MSDEIEELWSLAEECREWARSMPGNLFGLKAEFQRLADKLDAIAHRLAERLPT